MTPLCNGGIVSIFSQKFFQNFFTNTSHAGLNPPTACQDVIYGGDTKGGRGHFDRETPMPLCEGGGTLLIT